MSHSVIIEIEETNKWRVGEFGEIKKQIATFNSDTSLSVQEKLWLRMCVPLVYAHWEGFVISSLKVLITYLNLQSLKPCDVASHLTVFGLDNAYDFLKGKQSISQKIEFTEKFHTLYYNNAVRFPKKIETKANLKFDVLENICIQFGFDHSNFDEVKLDLNKLVDIRNSIAHGENSYILARTNIKNFVDLVQRCMEKFLLEIDRFLIEKTYLRA